LIDNYGKLYEVWRRVVDKCIENDSIDEWRNIRALYEHFRGRFMDGIQMIRD